MPQIDTYSASFVAMASPCEVVLAARDESDARLHMQAAVDEVRRIERKFSRYLCDSIVQRINTSAGATVEIDDETAALFDFADQLFELSDGLFDVTSGVLRRAWDFKSSRLPTPAEVEAALACVGWHHVKRGPRTVALQRSGMEVDFGGFGKEYAADRAATVLLDRGLQHGFINLGGDIRAFGPQLDGSPWRIGIRHPDHADRLLASIALSSGGLATSGDYERYFIHEGRRYCHVLNPRTGWPVTHWRSVSALAPVCVAAGALTTIAMLKEREGAAWLDTQGAPYLAMDTGGHTITQKIGGLHPDEPGETPTTTRVLQSL